MRTTFERGLDELRSRVTQLGEQVDRAIYLAVESLRLRQPLLSDQVITNDKEINRERFAIEEASLTLLATQSPVAHDLRLVAATMYIATELERIGDHAKGIARINKMMGDEPLIKPLVDIPKMAEQARLMLREALQAFIKLDAQEARRVADLDDPLDDLYDTVYLDLLEIMSKEPDKVSRATHLLWAAHNLERCGDRAVNICERVIFVATGEMVEITGHLNG